MLVLISVNMQVNEACLGHLWPTERSHYTYLPKSNTESQKYMFVWQISLRYYTALYGFLWSINIVRQTLGRYELSSKKILWPT